MYKKSVTALTAAALLAGAAIGWVGAAQAQDDAAATWTKYQEAVRLAELCRDMSHDSAAWGKMGPYIDSKVNHEIGGGERLTLIETAKTDARKMAAHHGCDSDDSKGLLALYDAELAPLLQ